jgi:hypothetical protein
LPTACDRIQGCLDEQSGQLAFFAYVGVDGARNFTEAISGKGAFRLHDQYTGILEKLELNHRRFLRQRAAPRIGAISFGQCSGQEQPRSCPFFTIAIRYDLTSIEATEGHGGRL